MDKFEEDAPSFKVGRMEGDLRRYWRNRPLAQRYADEGQRKYDSTLTATTEFEPNHGFVAVLYAVHNLPDAWAEGYEVKTEWKPEKSPADWHSPQASKARPAGVGTPTTAGPPVKGATARVWAIADQVGAASRADRAKVIAACEAEGINPSTAATQWSKYAKSKGW